MTDEVDAPLPGQCVLFCKCFKCESHAILVEECIAIYISELLVSGKARVDDLLIALSSSMIIVEQSLAERGDPKLLEQWQAIKDGNKEKVLGELNLQRLRSKGVVVKGPIEPS